MRSSNQKTMKGKVQAQVYISTASLKNHKYWGGGVLKHFCLFEIIPFFSTYAVSYTKIIGFKCLEQPRDCH